MPRFDLHKPEVWEQLAPECQYRACPLAALAGISLTQLKRSSHELFQTSPQKLLNRWRREDSLLALEDLDLKEAYEALGYKRQSHFSRDFREYSGIWPSKYKSLPTEDREYLKMALQSAASQRRCRVLLQVLSRKNEHISFRYKMVVPGTETALPGTTGQLPSGYSLEHHFRRQ